MARRTISTFMFVAAAVLLLGAASGKTVTMTAVGFDVGRPVETACHGGDISFQKDTNFLYVGVPESLFVGSNGKNNCGKSIKVSCLGAFENDAGQPCKNSKPVTLTIIDTVDGDSIEISNKAFNTISDFDFGRLTVKVVA